MVKNIFLFILFLSTVASSYFLYRLSIESADWNRIIEEERYGRLVAERDLQLTQGKFEKLQAEYDLAHSKLSKMQAILNDEQTAHSVLKDEVKRVKRIKDKLERELSATLKKSTTVVMSE